METTRATLLPRIESLLSRTRIGAARFGQMACGDRNLVFDLRKGEREFKPSTLQRVGAFVDQLEANTTKQQTAA